ncbi:asparagine synthase (glutamine-hydrolyzing) [Campylobacter iguaniorum]|uniref:asparagine synthase (glutamine-hydrolyzing) n=2 Tax=Campylobacter iguaniorum TaxID=1244531 RepID=A0A076FAW6_9BACT|nr:asparagine synthase (glutamine-hydrolyzing) [Campylobacter iguaniorum]
MSPFCSLMKTLCENLNVIFDKFVTLGNTTIFFDEDIYNKQFLGDKICGNAKNSGEILLQLYEKYGSDFLSQLNGNFAFLIYDKDANLAFGANDTLGAKQLFYYKKSGKFIFSTSIKSILSALNHTPSPNLKALDSYLSFMKTTSYETFYEGIFCLNGGEYFRLENGKFEINSFENLRGIDEINLDFETASKKALDLLAKSLNLRVASSQNPCFLLSGGIDSSMICALYKQIYGGKFDTFSLGFDEFKNYDESAAALESSRFLDSNYHQITLNKSDFLDILDNFFEIFDEPIADSACLPLYHLSKKITQNGFCEAFSGEGGDECFLGYRLYFRVLEFYQKSLSKQDYPPISKDYEYLRRKELGLPIYGSFGEVFTHFGKSHLLKNYALGEPLSEYKNDYTNLRQMSYIDFKIWTGVAMSKTRQIGVKNALNFKTPFLDLDLVKFSLSLADSTKYQHSTKDILKFIAKDFLPKEIIERKKKGFSSPFMEWILAEFGKTIIDEILSVNKLIPLFDEEFVKILYQKATQGRFKQHLYSLFIFAKWFKKNYI